MSKSDRPIPIKLVETQEEGSWELHDTNDRLIGKIQQEGTKFTARLARQSEVTRFGSLDDAIESLLMTHHLHNN